MYRKLLTAVFSLFSALTFSQGFIASLEEIDLITLLNKPAIVTMADGSEITGKFGGAVLISGYLDKVTIKSEDGEKLKLKPEEMVRLQINASGFSKMAMISSSASSIKEVAKRDFSEIKNREYIVFETAQRSNKAAKFRMMQLLNPGFDDKIKVFADPNANQTTGIGIGGIKLTGGEDKSYLMVTGGSKAIVVKKSTYRKNFEELYQGCPDMVRAFQGEKIKWEDVAGHVFAFNEACKE
ncbi:MAG: hypothetical protein ACO3FI_07685 [Cyclobacteriaceae bacterium]